MQIIITGATGQLGGLILENLLQKMPAGQIIAGVRDPDKTAELRQLGLETRIVNYDVQDTLDKAFVDVTKLLLISSPHTDDTVWLAQHLRVIDAAQRAGVDHMLYTSFAFSQKGKSDNVHSLTEQAIQDSGLRYTFLRNALYIDFVNVLGLKEAVSSGVLTTLPGNWRFNAVSRSDLALATAAILAHSGPENQSYELTASQTWTFDNLAKALSGLAGKPVIHREDPEIQHWIYNFLSTIDTVSTTTDLERWMGREVTPLKESILPFIRPQEKRTLLD
ncbi:NAD(P)H-binding protein [Paenibacillus tianjinensis]|uniref:NAD(P)H-binding protein n=1 Tax=Paenibacillus tianjinensis TaxID=2810347 RepID=A0ABX7LN69_9BACL|nr:NmrA family NAD(P)-binding protein [Paenibacillus tianjinensis]QSF47297.1 NAD(P)H-binding protein [Paenibacillus tianjinensis]